jgi:hypothetical protein
VQSNFYVDAKDILNATNGGLDIIFYLYPQAEGSEHQKSRKKKRHLPALKKPTTATGW